jgi:hypothetical protein
LLGLNLLNFVVGALLGRRAGFWRGVGVQAMGWALINMLIAVIGGMAGQRRERAADAHAPETLAKETRNLRLLLWVNAGLDVLYMLGGWRWANRKVEGADPTSAAFQRGNGIGIMIQGAILMIFDVVHALCLSSPAGTTPTATSERTPTPEVSAPLVGDLLPMTANGRHEVEV